MSQKEGINTFTAGSATARDRCIDLTLERCGLAVNVLIGYASNAAEYTVWYPGTTETEKTKHVKIDENNLYFKNS